MAGLVTVGMLVGEADPQPFWLPGPAFYSGCWPTRGQNWVSEWLVAGPGWSWGWCWLSGGHGQFLKQLAARPMCWSGDGLLVGGQGLSMAGCEAQGS